MRLLDRLWRLDDRAYESRAGWLMPGGIFWKLGRRDRRQGERFWPYLLGLGDGWLYNAARERTARETTSKVEPPA
jgi:hypothetical protein